MNKLQKLRMRAGLTRQQLADQAGVMRQSIQQYERDGTLPLVSQAIRIARVLGVSVDDIWPVDDEDHAA